MTLGKKGESTAMNLRNLAKIALPPGVMRSLRDQRRRYLESRYQSQGTILIHCGDHVLSAPECHALAPILTKQPYRDVGVRIAARFVAEKYPEATFVDIGANIGDTAALMASEARNPLILVEASDYFFRFLEDNTRALPNPVTLIKALVCDGHELGGHLRHWGGTATFVETDSKEQSKTRRLAEIADEKTRFVKIDTDGHDFRIIRGSIEWLAEHRPALLFEDQVRSREDLAEANDTVRALAAIGFEYFVVWDDPGFHLVSTSEPRVLEQLHRYQYKIWERSEHKTICNYDVLCLHRDDRDIYEKACRWAQEY